MKSIKRYKTVYKNADAGRGRIFWCIGLLFGVFILLWSSLPESGESLRDFLGYGISMVSSGSMSPVLEEDELVIVKLTQEVETGDVIVYEKDDGLIIHRVIEKEGDTLVTQGDANPSADEPIDITLVQGKMVGHIPVIGGVLSSIHVPMSKVAARFFASAKASDSAKVAAWVLNVEPVTKGTSVAADSNGIAQYTFTVSNVNSENVVCEVDFDYNITIELPESVSQCVLSCEGESTQYFTDTTKFTASGYGFKASEAKTYTFTLELKTTDKKELKGVKVTVDAAQKD